uniref:Uncharacterized protein n=1 Tax=Magallana gigas TaxID=29159 RepID=K1PU18_MAGGI
MADSCVDRRRALRTERPVFTDRRHRTDACSLWDRRYFSFDAALNNTFSTKSSDSQGSGACTSGLHNKTMECSTAVDNPVFNMADECMCSSTLPVPVFCENGLPQTETSVDISDVITHL